jgi:hypothetical protein
MRRLATACLLGIPVRDNELHSTTLSRHIRRMHTRAVCTSQMETSSVFFASSVKPCKVNVRPTYYIGFWSIFTSCRNLPCKANPLEKEQCIHGVIGNFDWPCKSISTGRSKSHVQSIFLDWIANPSHRRSNDFKWIGFCVGTGFTFQNCPIWNVNS